MRPVTDQKLFHPARQRGVDQSAEQAAPGNRHAAEVRPRADPQVAWSMGLAETRNAPSGHLDGVQFVQM